MNNVGSWADADQRYLAGALRQLREVIVGRSPDKAEVDALAAQASAMEHPPSLLVLTTAFGLSPFERDLLLLCTGMELDADFQHAVRSSAADDEPRSPTFGMALALLPGAHWSALAPSAPLRRWRLIEIGQGPLLTQAPLRAAERVLGHLAGVQTLAPELEALVILLDRTPALVPTHEELAERAVRTITTAVPTGAMPLVQLIGRNDATTDVAASIGAAIGCRPAILHAEDLPADAREQEHLARLWEREAVLSGLLLVVDCVSLGDHTGVASHVTRFLDRVSSPTVVLARRMLAGLRRGEIHLTVEAPSLSERMLAWRSTLGEQDPDLDIERIAGQFPLNLREIRAVVEEFAAHEPIDGAHAGWILWDLCRERSRPRLEHLTDRVMTSAGWDDLVLPEQQKQTLREIAGHARMRNRVYGTWGFADKGPRGLGISALFAGPSGTGKTMAAEVLAAELRLDMYRIDLGRVVSKYIGETEKNLGHVFDEAEAAGGVILLFDEADALFGKRTEVRDSHDRYANLEVSYLLQRMEAYAGLAILTTNMKGALDPAFLRRIRFVIQFPFPDVTARTRIWQGAFPSATPTNGLVYERLARLNVAGGNIRNIALNAAFATAVTDSSVGMVQVLAAARSEYAKLERPLPATETQGWT
jgi:hypothetical protein